MQLSYSALSVFKNCPKCFWLDRNKKIARPRGIMSSLPTGIDKLLKAKLELYRGSLPPELAVYKELQGYTLYAGSDLDKMRNWKSNPLKMIDSKKNTLVGAFDDLLHNPETDTFAYLDYKTKGSEPDQAYCENYYQSQCDIYTRFLEIGGKKVANFGVLLYFWPVESTTGLLQFQSKAFFLRPESAAAEELFSEAITCLEGPIPRSSDDCEYCSFLEKRQLGQIELATA